MVPSSICLDWLQGHRSGVASHGVPCPIGLGRIGGIFPVGNDPSPTLSGSQYSRYYLGYHSPRQIAWGLGIGSLLAIVVYALCDLVPERYPNSLLGQFKTWILSNPVSTFVQLRDGWAIWPDAGRESEWRRWRDEWDKKRWSQDTDKNK
jgi:hypothetical protein